MGSRESLSTTQAESDYIPLDQRRQPVLMLQTGFRRCLPPDEVFINSGNGLDWRSQAGRDTLSGAADALDAVVSQRLADDAVHTLEHLKPTWIWCPRRQLPVTVIVAEQVSLPNCLVAEDPDLCWTQIGCTQRRLADALAATLDPAYLFEVTWSKPDTAVHIKLWVCKEGFRRDRADYTQFIEEESVTHGDD